MSYIRQQLSRLLNVTAPGHKVAPLTKRDDLTPELRGAVAAKLPHSRHIAPLLQVVRLARKVVDLGINGLERFGVNHAKV